MSTDSNLPISTANVTQAVKIRMGETGMSAVPARTIMDNFDEIVAKCGDQPALFQKGIPPAVRATTSMILFVVYYNVVVRFCKTVQLTHTHTHTAGFTLVGIHGNRSIFHVDMEGIQE